MTTRFPVNVVECRDCIEGMSSLPDGCVDVVVADPPYNLSTGSSLGWADKGWDITDEDWDEMPLEVYLEFTRRWMSEASRLLSETGSMWVFGTYHNIGLVNYVAQQLELLIINEVAWIKRNAFPNVSCRRMTASHETILWIAKDKGYRFNYEEVKTASFPGDVFKSAGKQLRSVWDVPANKDSVETKFGKHPTQKPLSVIKRLLLVSAPSNGLLLSPFAGSGTDCVAAKEWGLDFIGYELDESYCEVARKRLAAVAPSLF